MIVLINKGAEQLSSGLQGCDGHVMFLSCRAQDMETGGKPSVQIQMWCAHSEVGRRRKGRNEHMGDENDEEISCWGQLLWFTALRLR